MTFSPADFQAFAERRRLDRAAASQHDLARLAQAAVKIDLLTGDANWDTFLSYIQAGIEKVEGIAAGHERMALDPMTTAEETARAKMMALECRAMARAWKLVIEMPADIRHAGSNAKTLLEKLEGQAG